MAQGLALLWVQSPAATFSTLIYHMLGNVPFSLLTPPFQDLPEPGLYCTLTGLSATAWQRRHRYDQAGHRACEDGPLEMFQQPKQLGAQGVGRQEHGKVCPHRAVGAELVGVQQDRRVAVELALDVQDVLRLQAAVVAEEPQIAAPDRSAGGKSF